MTLVVQNTIDPQLYSTLATLTGSQILTNKTIKIAKEPVTFAGAAPGGITDFDVATQPIMVYNTATQNFILNVRGNATTTLNSLLQVGESVSINLLVPNGITPYYITNILIDGNNVGTTIRYQGGTAFTGGNSNCTDLYVLFIIKVAANTWSVYVSQTRFA